MSATELFAHRFGFAPEVTARASGRVNLLGEHTDYNDGYVMPMAIERYIVVVGGRPAEARDGGVELFSQTMDERDAIDLAHPAPPLAPRWTSYVRGVLEEFRQLGVETGPLNLVIDSNVPLGGGLSSSAALEVAVATLVEQAANYPMTVADKARLCQRAENIHVGVHGPVQFGWRNGRSPDAARLPHLGDSPGSLH
jgi:galactokinase